jgi:hypothetical protein
MIAISCVGLLLVSLVSSVGKFKEKMNFDYIDLFIQLATVWLTNDVVLVSVVLHLVFAARVFHFVVQLQ